MAEGILRSLLPAELAPLVRVASAGTGAGDGLPATPLAVQVCADSSQLASPWCEVTMTRVIPAALAARMGTCRRHHAPPGESRRTIPGFDPMGEPTYR